MTASTDGREADRVARVLDAQRKAAALFDMVEAGLIQPGERESDLSEEIYELAAREFGVIAHWHKRVIRAGPNTLQPYVENPPDRVIQADDIMFVDLGPVFEAWEADFGRTFVLGHDRTKIRLRDDLEPVFIEAKSIFNSTPSMTGSELYRLVCDLAKRRGWEHGGVIAGHLVGEFPHERIDGDKVTFYITAGNHLPITSCDPSGMKRHWILEIHLVDRERQIGGFYEQLLTI